LRDSQALKTAGLVACLLGVLAMLSGRYTAGAPTWLVYVGISGIVFGWGLMGLSMARRAAEARAQMRELKR